MAGPAAALAVSKAQKPAAAASAGAKTAAPKEREPSRRLASAMLAHPASIPADPPQPGITAWPLCPAAAPLSGFLQPKLAIGAVDDPLEREADGVAEKVMRMPDPALSIFPAPPRISRKCAECEREDEAKNLRMKSADATPLQISRKCAECEREDKDKKKLQMKSAGAAQPLSAAPPIVHEVLQQPGQPLEARARAFFEPRFGQDFSAVRVHRDAISQTSAQAIKARAYTAGNHIVFGPGHYAFESDAGRLLIAHELAHVVQQSPNLGRDADRAMCGVAARARHGADANAEGTAILRRAPDEATQDAAGGDPEAQAVWRAAKRARASPDDDTIMTLSASEIVYRLVDMFFPQQAGKISGVAYERAVKGAHARQTGANIEIVVGKDFVLGVEPDGLLTPTLALRAMFQSVAPSPPGEDRRHGLIAGLIAESRTAEKGREEAEGQKQYTEALDKHKAQQQRVNDLLKGFQSVPAIRTKDQSNPETKSHAYPTTLLKNTVEWIEKRVIPLYVLTPTHYSDNVYFDTQVSYPNIGGTYDRDPKKSAGDPNVTTASGTELGKASTLRRDYGKPTPEKDVSFIYLFVGRDEQLTMERLSSTLEHEVQHIADWSPTIAKVAGQLDLQSVKSLYETEFRAYWIEASVQEQTCLNLTGSGVTCFSVPAPQQQAALPLAPAPKISGVHTFTSASASQKPTPITVKLDDVKSFCQLCGPSPQQKQATSDFNNQRQQEIFRHLLSYTGDQFDCYYVCSQEFRDFVHKDPSVGGKGIVAGQNIVNSLRIEELLENVQLCSKSLSAGDPKLTEVENAAAKLDAVDKAFLKDQVQSKPFWDVLSDKLPPFEVAKLAKLIRQ